MKSPADLLQLSGAYWGACALHAAVKLDIFSPLAEKAFGCTELAGRLNLSERGLGMLLDAMVALGLLEKKADRFNCSEFAVEWLSAGSPHNLRHIILHHHHLVPGWARLDEAVREGESVRSRVAHDGEEQEREDFLLGMFNLANLSAPKVASVLDFSKARRLLDVGGGPGTWAIHFCKQNPQLQAVIYDLPTTRPYAENAVKHFGLSERILFSGGDFQQDALPAGFDVAWLSHVLHAESPEGCLRLLKKVVASLESGGQLLVQEFILDEQRTSPLFPALFSLNMLLGTSSGQAYSEEDLARMMRAAGLDNVRRLPLEQPNGAGIMAGRKSGE